jgi:hypothetical protein
MLLHFLIAISHALGTGIDPGICIADTSEAKTSKWYPDIDERQVLVYRSAPT